MKHWWLYVLRLEQGKWYVGITSRTPEKRFHEHLNGRGAYWTELYRPIEIASQKYLGDLSEDEAKGYENKVVRRYMREKGVNSVRGGDLLDKRNYIVRFGYIFYEFGWRALMTVTVLLVIIVILSVQLQMR